MKNFKFKWLLLSIVLSIASINTMWAWDCGWWDEGTACITFSINGTDKTLGTVNRNKSDYADHDLGTVTTSLKIKGAWGKNFGKDCLNAMKLHYRVKVRDASSSAAYSEYSLPHKSNFDTNNQCWQKDDINADLNINNLAPGNYEIEYYMQIYPKNDKSCEFVCLDNGGNRYHANFTIPSKNLTIATDDAHGSSVSGSVTGVKKGYAYTITATPARGYRFKNWTATSGGSSVSIADASSSSTTVTFNDFSNNVTIKAVFEVKWMFKGSWDSWTADVELSNATGSMRSGTKTLTAGTTYAFKIWNRDGGEPYGCDATLTKSEYEYNFYNEKSTPNCSITVATTGTYHFNWDEDNHQLTVIYPDLTEKKILAKNTILYFDARNANSSGWQNKDFIARFWFKYFDSGLDHGSADCAKSNPLGVPWMYYTTVPNNDYIGRVQMNRINPSNTSEVWCSAYIDYAYERTNGDENCLAISSDDAGKCGDFRPQWTYYRPPMSSAALTNDGSQTVTYGGDGGENTPYLVATSSSIYVTATSTSSVPEDTQMQAYYQFKKEGSNDGEESSTSTHTYTASGTTGTKEAMTVVARNKYHNDYGTASPVSTAVYYEARTPYTISYNKGTNGTGSRDSEIKLKGVNFTLPNSAVFERTGYTQTGWTTSDGGSQTQALGGSYTTDDNEEFFPVWTANATTVTLNANTSNHGSGANQSVTATYDAALPSFTATTPATGYHLVGYYDNATSGTKIINADGTFAANNGIWNRTDGSTLTLWAHYEINTFTVSFVANYPSGTTDNDASMSNEDFTYGTVQNLTANAFDCEGYEFAGWKKNNEGDVIDDEADGCALTTSNDVTVELYAQWTDDDDYYYKGASADGWSTPGNWTKGVAPSASTNNIIVLKPVTLPTGTNVFASVTIRPTGGSSYDPIGADEITPSGKLNIPPTGALVVNSITGATENTLVLESSASGTGALVSKDENTTAEATVQFYTKAKKDGGGKYINQYFGTPVESASKLNYYGAYLRKFDVATDKWISFTEESTMSAWTAYRIMREETSNETFEISGTLILPGTTTHKEKELTLTRNGGDTDNMFANSWTAPIDVTKLSTEDDFVGAKATIYIFNAGSSTDYSTNGGSYGTSSVLAGQWLQLPIDAVKANPGNYAQKVIPSQQAFLVQTDGSGGTYKLTLDYNKVVYTPCTTSVDIKPTLAPKRYQEDDLEIMSLYLSCEHGADRVLLYMRDDFSQGYDNGWEGYKFSGSAFAPQLYAHTEAGEMSITALKDAEGTVLGLYSGNADSEYTFTFGYEGDQTWYLNDLEAEQSAEISEGNTYDFTITPSTAAEHRFVVSKTPIKKITTGVDDIDGGVKVRKQMINGSLYIIRDGRIYNAEGMLVK